MAYIEIPFSDLANCYAYAVNCQKTAGKGRATPGAVKKKTVAVAPFDETKLMLSCLSDGCIALGDNRKIDSPPKPPANHYLIAVMIADNKQDFHFYRQGPNKIPWSHKIGPQGRVTMMGS